MKTIVSETDEIISLVSKYNDSKADADKQHLVDFISNAEKGRQSEIIEDISGKYRKWFTIFVLATFTINSAIVLLIVIQAFYIDLELVKSDKFKASERLIDGQVIMVLIAGTVTQTAVAFGVLTQFVFKVFDKNKAN